MCFLRLAKAKKDNEVAYRETIKVCDYEKENVKYVDWSFDVFIDDGYATHSIIITSKDTTALPLSGYIIPALLRQVIFSLQSIQAMHRHQLIRS